MAILKKTAKAEQAVAETAVKSPVVEQAPSHQFFAAPREERTRQFLSRYEESSAAGSEP